MDQKWSENGQKGKKEVLGHFLEFGLWDRLDIAYCDFTLYSLTFDKITRSCWITRKSEKCIFGWFKGKASKQARKQNKQKLQSFQNSRIRSYFSNLLNIKKGKHGADFFKISKVFSGFQVLTSWSGASRFTTLQFSTSVLNFSWARIWESRVCVCPSVCP